MKCTAVGIVSSLAALLLRRYHPELALLLAAVTIAVLLLAGTEGFQNLREELKEAERLLGGSSELLQPMLKCLGISAVSRIGAGLCRDSAQAAIAGTIETLGVLSAAMVAMPVILRLLQTIGGML